MSGMFQNFLMKKMLKSKMKGVPEEQQEQLFDAIEKNPEFFKKIAEEIQAKMKGGKKQITATMEVMQTHQSELHALMEKK